MPKLTQIVSSKTMWLSFILVALSVIQANLPDLQEVLPTNFYAKATFVLAVAVACLRWVTTVPLNQK